MEQLLLGRGEIDQVGVVAEEGMGTPFFDGGMKLLDMLGVDGFLYPTTGIFGEDLQCPDFQLDRFLDGFPGTSGN